MPLYYHLGTVLFSAMETHPNLHAHVVYFSCSCGTLHFFIIRRPLSTLLLLSATMFSALDFGWGVNGKERITEELDNLKDSTDKLVDQISINYNNAFMTNEIGQVIVGKTTVEDVLSKVVKISEKRFNFDRGIIMLANKDKNRPKIPVRHMDTAKAMFDVVRFCFISLDKEDSKGIFVVSFREQRPYLINDINEIER